MSKEALSNLRSLLMTLPEEFVKSPTMPVEIATKEARLTALHCADDAAVFTRFKIDSATMAEQIERAAAATDAAEAEWDRVAIARTEHEEEWQSLKPKAYEMRDDYIDLLEFIFENEEMPNELAALQHIAAGSSDADMAQDLTKIHQLITPHAAMLASYEVSADHIAAIAAMYTSVNALMAHAIVDRTNTKAELDLRNRAYSHMMHLVTTVRKAGKIAFKRDEKQRKRYRSDYKSELNRAAYARRKAQSEDSPTPLMPNPAAAE